MNARHAILGLVLILAPACTPKEDKAASADAGAATQASAVASAAPSTSASAATTAAPATAENDPLPSHKDAAKAVYGEITKANYKSALETIEKSD